ncbi:bifunctional [glutamine synthetase] adenylyltransferase/[glutamine synthetase]-adenylyl-L-tyrosine phosphorylase [uncultured Tessaracoccus sp.]|uniref:bifunctional [glutamine synthetase] adenylyltransferase/[glutamine synthetase]-adenylyl-L-tyrosine phosphorylase n=1 Tax=uncultured Tessaracoccus sp. TaxID=905023 RepID=UPI0026128E9C|nr:bifunctional [glutamine synthetase] adenylyltransferase/[glutamine synthetase]-adenylyl-L-tyrosine phosphorylase [uncultured Tessaracoccus sp.]
MARLHSPQAEFARRGFAQPTSAARIWQSWPDDVRAKLDLDWFAPVGDRFGALHALDAIVQAGRHRELLGDADWARRVLLVAGASSVLATALGREEHLLDLLRDPPRPRSADDWRRFFAERLPIVDGVCADTADELRVANRAALTLIAARDLEAEDPTALLADITHELAHVADAVLDTSLALARAEVPQWADAKLAVIALGKTGAQELNYISDVDVLYVAEPARDDVPTDHALAVATRIAAAQARICSARTSAGTIWTVDAALRPEGKAGPLVRTLESCRHYYERWAKPWEFQAMLKARPAAGDLQLGQAFVDMLAPKVWQVAHTDGFLPEMRAMRERVISLIPKSQADRDIKLASGGLRDTEFSVQLLQLVHGTSDERIRCQGTLDGLEALVAHGYIGRDDGAKLAQDYRIQRVIEHRIQLARLRRTHLVPDDEHQLAELSRTARIPDVWEQWKTTRRDVRRLRQRIFFSPLLDVVAQSPSGALLSQDAARARAKALGFLDPRAALTHIEALTTGTSRAAEIRRHLMPAMLEWIADGPNPDFGLLSFRQLSEALGEESWYLRALRDEGYMARRFATVASTSRFAVALLQRVPQSVRLLASDDDLQPRPRDELVAAFKTTAARHDDADRAVASMRALRRSELARIAITDVLGRVDVAQCGQALSSLADATLEAALDIARREHAAPELGIIALGRWGGSEMSYSSDLDAMFVVPDGTDAAGLEAATKLVRRAAEILGRPGPDHGLTLDSDLRPGGKSGPQVRTLASYRTYYERWAATWERQMLLRARHGAGDAALVAQLLHDADPYRYPPEGLAPSEVTEIRRLKSRMERERIPRGIDRDRHLKLGPGGLADIEWTVQLLQLQHGHANPELQTTSTLAALDAARSLGLIAAPDADALQEAWRHASSVRDAVMLVRGRAADALPTDPRDLAAINTLLGIDGPASELVEITRRHARRAAAVVERYFWGE